MEEGWRMKDKCQHNHLCSWKVKIGSLVSEEQKRGYLQKRKEVVDLCIAEFLTPSWLVFLRKRPEELDKFIYWEYFVGIPISCATKLSQHNRRPSPSNKQPLVPWFHPSFCSLSSAPKVSDKNTNRTTPMLSSSIIFILFFILFAVGLREILKESFGWQCLICSPQHDLSYFHSRR